MPSDPLLNVFSGEDALHDFYHPEKSIPIPLVELPERLNPYKKDGVHIYAKLLSHTPATNVKLYPALNMILRGQEKGKITEDTHTLVEYSSGSTVISMGILAHIYGIETTKAYLSNKTSPTKLDLLRFFGLDLTLFAGTDSPNPRIPMEGFSRRRKTANKRGATTPTSIRIPRIMNLIFVDRPSDHETAAQHLRFCGLHRDLGYNDGDGPIPQVCEAVGGTCGCLHDSWGPRPWPAHVQPLAPVEFPWREAVDCIEEVAPFESYEKSLELCRNGLLVGPSSGLALLGLFKFLNKKKETGELDALRNPDGKIPCAFICCDQPFQYISEYFEKLGPSYFLPIRNSELIGVDPYNYNVDWEITPAAAHDMLAAALAPSASTPRLAVLDLRDAEDFASAHLPVRSTSPSARTRRRTPTGTHPPWSAVQAARCAAGAADAEFGSSSALAREGCVDAVVQGTRWAPCDEHPSKPRGGGALCDGWR
ncbi:tryptophan synthase beta subunit-like PLP-dependent enzyme [Mycena galopus ATCC 62051]|nr:tryptophan synthase beta subunit-like PLP-dependent enzyme [Mycena galopus ATCC 62051]